MLAWFGVLKTNKISCINKIIYNFLKPSDLFKFLLF